MAVKKKGTLPPPIWRTGGKAEHYAIEVLAAERELILERIKSARAEKSFTLAQRRQHLKAWSGLAVQLQSGIDSLKAAKVIRARCRQVLKNDAEISVAAALAISKNTTGPGSTAPPDTARQAIASCKNFAKCGEFSYFYCRTECKKRKTKTCDLIQGYKKGAA